MKVYQYIAAVSVALSLASMLPAQAVTVDASDIPTNLRDADTLQLTGTWNTLAFTDLAVAIGTTGFMASNTTLVSVDMSEAQIEATTDLYVNGGLSSNGVFVNCKALETVIMPEAGQAANFANLRQAFMNCSALTTIDLSHCSGLTSLNSAFENCGSLTEIDLSESTQLTGSSAMAGTFRSCVALTKVTLPSTISFASRTFGDCTALTAIDWTSYAGSEAPIFYSDMFDGISDLKAITLTVTEEVVSLFENDANWSRLTIEAEAGETPIEGTVVDASDIPTNLRDADKLYLTGTWNTLAFTDLAVAIGTTGFMASNTTLVSVDMSEAQIEAGTDLYVNGGLSSNGVFVNCKALETVIMPEAGQAANFANLRQAFMNCSALTTIDLSHCSGLTSLNSAFENCGSLTEIDLSESTQLTGSSAMAGTFRSCVALTKVTLPSTISFASRTFGDCTALTAIDWTSYAGSEAPIFYSDMFDGISDLKAITLTVADEVAHLFENDANWSRLTIHTYSGVDKIQNDAVVTFAGDILRTQRVVTDANIYSLNGALVMSQGVVNGEWSVASLPRGVYVLSYMQDGHRRSLKFVKR